MNTVSRITQSDTHFTAEMVVGGCRVFFNVSKAELHQGAALIRLKNDWVRETHQANHAYISREALSATAKEAVVLLRDEIETYFNEFESEDDDDAADE